jgi:hypothetical protein
MTYSTPTLIRVIKSRRIRWAGHVAWMGKGKVGKYEEQRPPETHRRRREENKVGDMDWINVTQYTERQRAFVTAAMNLRVQQNSGDFSTS